MTTVKVTLSEKEEEVKFYTQGVIFQFNTRIDKKTRTGILCKPCSERLVLIDLNSANRWDEPFNAMDQERFTIKQLEKKFNIDILFVADSAEIILK